MSYNIFGMVVSGFSDHGVVKVTFFPKSDFPQTEYFDIGSPYGVAGQFGGTDHWFNEVSNLDYGSLMDVKRATPFPKP